MIYPDTDLTVGYLKHFGAYDHRYTVPVPVNDHLFKNP